MKIIPKLIKGKEKGKAEMPIYQIVFNSTEGINKSLLPTYSQSRVISGVTSTVVFTLATNVENHFIPVTVGALTSAVYFITPVLNTITAIVNVNAFSTVNRRVDIASARTFTTASIAVFVDRNNPPVVNMTLLAVTNSTTFTVINSTGMSSVAVGDEVQFGNDRTTILSAMVTNISTDLLTVTINSARTIPINTIVSFFKSTTPPVMKFNNNVNYEIDWTTIERGKYKGSVSMEMWYGGTGSFATAVIQPQIYLDLGININTYEAGNPNFANNLGGSSSNFVGSLNSTGTIITTTTLRTSNETMSDFFIEWIPSNKPVNISLYGNTPSGTLVNQSIFTKTLWSDGQGCGDYILTLRLERLPDDTLPFYNILFNSRASITPINTSTASNFIQSFYWQVLPEGNYKCSYYTLGTVFNPAGTNTILSISLINQLYWNIPIPNTIEAGNDTTRPTNIWSLGLFYNRVQSILYSFWTTGFSNNSPFIISRPQTNNVQFLCRTNWDKSVNVLTGSQFPHYILCLRMEKQK